MPTQIRQPAAARLFRGMGRGRGAAGGVRLARAAGRDRSRQALADVLSEVAQLLARDEAILNSLSDAVMVSDLSANVLYLNPAGLRLYGFASLEEAQKPHAALRTGFLITGPDGQEIAPDRFPLMRVIAGEQVSGVEMTIRRPGATDSRTISYNGALARDAAGEPFLAVVTARDVTAQREQEAELRRAHDELQTLLDVSSSLVSTLDTSRLLHVLVSTLQDVTGAAFVTIFRLVGDELMVVDYVGPMPREEALMVRFPVHAAFGFHDTIRRGEPTYVEDLASDSPLAQEWRRYALAAQKQLSTGSRSWLSLPLWVQGRVVGAVRLAHPQPAFFAPDTIRLATGIANQAAVALENASLHAESRVAAVWEERERLARELHESVSQILFGVDMATYSALRNLDRNAERARERLELAHTLNKAALREMRALIHELRTDTIATSGLRGALEPAISSLKDRYGLNITFRFCPEPDVSLDVKESFYRVAIEAVNNAGKHAPGGPVHLTLCADDEALVLEVVDHGPGFDVAQGHPGRLGLRTMQERAARIGATLTLRSEAGVGTTVSMSYPLSRTPAA